MYALTLSNSLYKTCCYESSIVAWKESMPKSRSGKCGHTGPKARLLAFWRHAQVDIVSQPIVCVNIP